MAHWVVVFNVWPLKFPYADKSIKHACINCYTGKYKKIPRYGFHFLHSLVTQDPRVCCVCVYLPISCEVSSMCRKLSLWYWHPISAGTPWVVWKVAEIGALYRKASCHHFAPWQSFENLAITTMSHNCPGVSNDWGWWWWKWTIHCCAEPSDENHSPSVMVMVWGAIHHGGNSARVVLDGTINCQHYIEILLDQ